MIWEAALWCGLALGTSLLARALWPRLAPRMGEWGGMLGGLGPWAHSLLPTFLALVTGAISGRDAGLYGQEPARWGTGVLICLAAAVLLTAVIWWMPLPGVWPQPWRGALDEAHWALYRASGALWTGNMVAGAAVGLALGTAEWCLMSRPWRGGRGRDARAWLPLAPLVASSAIFALTRNAWLTAAAHAALLALARRTPQGPAAH